MWKIVAAIVIGGLILAALPSVFAGLVWIITAIADRRTSRKTSV
ncbi:MAG TPA: hypothetical protein VJ999_11410 [Candidatus Sulfotelmatobacter sp.]|nr:hypothetical protein [Candidatus Sulfotelmatobacter sp.]